MGQALDRTGPSIPVCLCLAPTGPRIPAQGFTGETLGTWNAIVEGVLKERYLPFGIG
jgi:hypothetical protein